MSLRPVIENVIELDSSTWQAKLTPDDVRRLAYTKVEQSGPSIIVVRGQTFSEDHQILTIDPDRLYVLSVGDEAKAIFMEAGPEIADSFFNRHLGARGIYPEPQEHKDARRARYSARNERHRARNEERRERHREQNEARRERHEERRERQREASHSSRHSSRSSSHHRSTNSRHRSRHWEGSIEKSVERFARKMEQAFEGERGEHLEQEIRQAVEGALKAASKSIAAYRRRPSGTA